MQNQQQQHHQDYSKERSLPPSPPRDSFSPSHVVDIDAIELEKENIQPIRQGRSAQVLSRLFSTQPVDRAHELALQHQRFQAELDRIDELKDPLDAYMRYVSWTIENYPQSGAQGHDSRLVSLLEQAIETFKDEERYRNDPRYVKLLILYSEKIEFPMDVFSFMETNKIGNEIAMFYEEHADYLESQEEYEKAKEIFLLGIHRRARPLGRLKRLFEEFERRAELFHQEQERRALEDSTMTRMPQRSRPADPVATSSNVNRRVLGTKISNSESIHVNETSLGHAPISSSNFSSSSTSSSGYQRPNARLQVFSDRSAQSSLSDRPRHVKEPNTSHESAPWKDLGTDHVRRKENIREAMSWKGTRLTAEDTLPKRPYPKLQIYRDPDSTVTEHQTSSAASSGLIGNIEGSEVASNSILSEPILHESIMRQSQDEKKPPEHQTEHCIIPFSSSQHTEKKLSRFPITKNEKGTQERLMIDLEQIYVAVDEFSIEEIRARQSCYASDINTEENSGRPHSRPPDKRPNTGNQQSDKYHCIPVAPSPQTLNYSTEDSNTQQSSQAKSLLHTSPKDFDDRVFDTARRMTASSPTLHTKYASAEMNKIFSDRSRSRRSMDSQWSAEDSQGVEEDELEKFTMAYSIPNIPWEFTTPSYEILENEIQDGYDEDDDQARDKTEDFLRKLEQGFPSTITQDIEALKRKRAEEGESNRLSFLPNKRSPFRSDPSRRQSDITMVIEQKVRQMQQHQHHQMEEQVEDTWRYVSEEASYVEDSESMGMRSHSLQDTENASSIGNDIPSTRTLQVFCDDTGNLDSDLNIPMLEDEAPPPFLDHEDLL